MSAAAHVLCPTLFLHLLQHNVMSFVPHFCLLPRMLFVPHCSSVSAAAQSHVLCPTLLSAAAHVLCPTLLLHLLQRMLFVPLSAAAQCHVLCPTLLSAAGHFLCRVQFELDSTSSEIFLKFDYHMYGDGVSGGEGLCAYLLDPSIKGW